MSDKRKDGKIVQLHATAPQSEADLDHPIMAALKRVGSIPPAPLPVPSDPFAGYAPNWLAISVFFGLTVASFGGAIVVAVLADAGMAGAGTRFSGAMAMIFGMITMSGALLYRYGREFWVRSSRAK